MPLMSSTQSQQQQDKNAAHCVERETSVFLCSAKAASPNEELTVHLGNKERLELSQSLVNDTIAVLPVKPDHISSVQGPFLEIANVAEDGTSVDLNIIHRVRAHFQHRPPFVQLGRDVRPSVPGPNIVELRESEDERLSSGGLSGAGMDSTTSLHHAEKSEAAASRSGELSGELSEGTPAALSGSLEGVVQGGSGAYTGDCSSPVELFSTDVAHLPLGERAVALRSQGSGLLCGDHAGNPPWELDPTQVLIGERLAVGGFAEVFFGKYQGTLVAIKVLVNVDAYVAECFRREVRLLAGLRHPNLILFMGYATRPHLAIVSEYMHRGSLFGLLRKGGNRPLELRLQRTVAVCVARGMAYLHTRVPPVLHMDLKSPNILIDDRWRVKVADFGLSRIRHHAFVSSGTGGGTPEWMAPEVLRSEQYNESADVYSYGVVLWEVLTGHQPWEGMHPMQVVGSVGFQGKTLPPPTQADPFLTQLSMRCVDPNPTQRPSFPQIMQELEQELAPSHHASLSASLSRASLNSSREVGRGEPALPMAAPAPLCLPGAATTAVEGLAGGERGGAGSDGEGMRSGVGQPGLLPRGSTRQTAVAGDEGAAEAVLGGEWVGEGGGGPPPELAPHFLLPPPLPPLAPPATGGGGVAPQQGPPSDGASPVGTLVPPGGGGRRHVGFCSTPAALLGSGHSETLSSARLGRSRELTTPHELAGAGSGPLAQNGTPFVLPSSFPSWGEGGEELHPPDSISHDSPFAKVQSKDLSDWGDE